MSECSHVGSLGEEGVKRSRHRPVTDTEHEQETTCCWKALRILRRYYSLTRPELTNTHTVLTASGRMLTGIAPRNIQRNVSSTSDSDKSIQKYI